MSNGEPEQRKFAAFDIDGTLFRWQLFHEVVFELKTQDYFSPETSHELDAAFTAWRAKEATWRDYEQIVIKAIESNLMAISPRAFEHVAEIVIKRSGKKHYGYTRRLLSSLKEQGYFLIAISGSQQEIAERFADLYGFDVCIGTIYERQGDAYTGKISRFVPHKKAELIREVMRTYNLTLTDSVAVGDSGGDLGMCELVERPIAFNPADDLLEPAMERGWPVVIERKNIAYTLERGPDGTYLLAKTDTY